MRIQKTKLSKPFNWLDPVFTTPTWERRWPKSQLAVIMILPDCENDDAELSETTVCQQKILRLLSTENSATF